MPKRPSNERRRRRELIKSVGSAPYSSHLRGKGQITTRVERERNPDQEEDDQRTWEEEKEDCDIAK